MPQTFGRQYHYYHYPSEDGHIAVISPVKTDSCGSAQLLRAEPPKLNHSGSVGSRPEALPSAHPCVAGRLCHVQHQRAYLR